MKKEKKNKGKKTTENLRYLALGSGMMTYELPSLQGHFSLSPSLSLVPSFSQCAKKRIRESFEDRKIYKKNSNVKPLFISLEKTFGVEIGEIL